MHSLKFCALGKCLSPVTLFPVMDPLNELDSSVVESVIESRLLRAGASKAVLNWFLICNGDIWDISMSSVSDSAGSLKM